MADRALSDQVTWIDRNWPMWGPQGRQAGIVSLTRLESVAQENDEADILDRVRRTRTAIQASLS